jgi:hypothetical protein
VTGPVPNRVADLLGVSQDAYGAEYRTHMLEQWKVCVSMADEISKRRHGANAFFLSINTATIAFLGIVQAKPDTHAVWFVVAGLAGLTLSLAWQRTIQSYRDLNTAKFAVIHEIEQHLPVRPFDAEWSFVNRGADAKLYWPVSHLESRIPWVFCGMYLFLIASVCFN